MSDDLRSYPEASQAQPTDEQISLLRVLRAAVIVTDLTGTITYWNPFAGELYGWPEEEVLGRNIMEITVTSETEQQAKEHMEVLLAGGSWAGEFQVRCKNGTHLPALVTLSAMRDRNGQTIGIVGVSQDLREMKQVQESLETRVQERTAEYNAATASLRQLSARIMQLRDEERRRLARELHDSVGQLLAAIKMNIEVVRATPLSAPAARAAAENTQLVDQVSTEIRTISYLLHPPLLDEVGLSSALRLYVEGFSDRSKVAVTLDVAPDLGRLEDEMEIAIFRIVQESLTNVHRHSGSQDATVRILEANGQIQVEIRDTGDGIPDQVKKELRTGAGGGVGFRGMRERVAQLGGNLEIHSNHTGTTVIATLPDRKPARAA